MRHASLLVPGVKKGNARARCKGKAKHKVETSGSVAVCCSRAGSRRPPRGCQERQLPRLLEASLVFGAEVSGCAFCARDPLSRLFSVLGHFPGSFSLSPSLCSWLCRPPASPSMISFQADLGLASHHAALLVWSLCSVRLYFADTDTRVPGHVGSWG